MVKGGAPDSAKLVYMTLKYLRSISLGFIVIINYIVFMGATNQQASLGGGTILSCESFTHGTCQV